jgi:hypothetical protein
MRRFLLPFAALVCHAVPVIAQPVAPTPAEIAALHAASQIDPRRAADSAPLTVNIASREEVRQFYRAIYSASENVPMGWTGSYTTGAAGDTAAAFKEATRLRVNFFRALAGLPASIVLNTTFSTKDQQAALMMSANNTLQHTGIPTTWTFYTAAGAEAAASSNLALGNAGADAISAYISDYGANNTAVGHRRWIFYPQTREMGTGDVPGTSTLSSANALWVVDSQFGTTRPTTRTTQVPYPAAGYMPYQLVWPRWSFGYPGADFSVASVTMTRNGQNVAVAPEVVSGGVGENTLVWVYDGLDSNSGAAHPLPAVDTVYTVNVRNVNISGVPQNFSYNVTVFDPDVAGADFTPVTVAGPVAPTVGITVAYTAAKQAFAGSFDWRSLQLAVYAKIYGAESGLDGITAATSGDYSVVQNGVVGAGTASYHLAHSTRTSQILTLPELLFIGGSNATVIFLSRLGFATSEQVAHVQVSADDGISWSDVYTQAGTGGAGEPGFVARSASLAAFANRTLRVRLNYTVSSAGSAFPQTTNGVGWYVDNLTFTGVQNVTAGATSSVSTGTTFSFTPAVAGSVGLQARGVLFGAYPLEWGPVAFVNAVAPGVAPTFSTQPASQSVGAGGLIILTATASGGPTLQWQLNGSNLSGATGTTLTLNNVQPSTAGLYTVVATSGTLATTSDPAIIGVTAPSEVIGAGAVLQPTFIPHPNGNHYDQVLLNGTAESITTPGYTVRTSFIDLNDDIVQVEFAGAGTLSLVLDNPSGPALPLNYNQAANYMKGNAGIVITGADETTNVSVFTVGRATAFDFTGAYDIVQPISATNNPANNGSPLFVGHASTAYDGIADIAFIAISSTNGKFGGVRASDANCFATKGLTGIYAPGVQFTGPVFISDINASAAATPVFIIGSSPDTRITGGDLLQANGQPVKVNGLTQLKFTAGTKSTGATLLVQTNKAVLQQNGIDVTAQVVVNPSP